MAESILLKSGGTSVSDECTATSDKVLKGYTYVGQDTDDELAEGSLEIQSVINFNLAAYSATEIIATWVNPSKGPYSGVIIRYDTSGYPSSITDGILGYEGAGDNLEANALSSAKVSGLTYGTTYYISSWCYINTNYGKIYTPIVQSICETLHRGQKSFTGSTTWTIPDKVTSIDVFCVNGGNSGERGVLDYYWAEGGNGGGGGYTKTQKNITVTPGQVVTISIGSGGQPNRGLGGTTTVKINGITVSPPAQKSSMNGGSGGGEAGKVNPKGTYIYAGRNGGSNGGNGGTWSGITGTGQGTTTRAFGEPNGTLYAGGGGGGGAVGQGGWPSAGAGGAGGGGWGGGTSSRGNPGGAGTGGGAGGGNGGNNAYDSSNGGSGIAIIRWGY